MEFIFYLFFFLFLYCDENDENKLCAYAFGTDERE